MRRHVLSVAPLPLLLLATNCAQTPAPADAAPADAAPADAAPADAVARDAADADGATPPWLVCGSPGVGCDRARADACPAGQTCALVALLPQPRDECVPARDLALGHECDPHAGACAAGLDCIDGRCTRVCCGAADDAMCAATFGTARSRCVGLTSTASVYACTIPGPCEYAPQDGCGPGEYCYPQSALAESVCGALGSATEGATCTIQNGCARGLTCIFPAGSTSFGECHVVCDPRHSACTSGHCERLTDRPIDFGQCTR